MRVKEAQTEKTKVAMAAVVAIIIFVAIIASAIASKDVHQSDKAAPASVDLNANVHFTGTQFVITNNDPFDWKDVRLEVNDPGMMQSGFVLNVPTILSGNAYTVGVMQFAKPDGERLNPITTKPQSISISCQTVNGSGFYYGGWK